MGVSISDYLLKRRIGLACQLLQTTQLSIQEIATRSGMEEPAISLSSSSG